MTNLIKMLKNEHRTILTLLSKVKTGNLSLEEKEAYLLTIKSLLKNHFHLEDEKLYPGLKKLSTTENGASQTVKEFTVGLDKIGDLISSFFNQSDKQLENIDRNSDFTKIIKLLEVRIVKEEKDLYPLYDRLFESSKQL